ncbi:MAG: hypothetical protein JXR05_00335 [Flavobacteriaceae bacterium]
MTPESIQVRKPNNFLTGKETASMLHHYDMTRKPVLEKTLGHEDTRINFHSIDELENYIKYVKEISREKGINLTGINFVSASYPENTTQGIANYQTIMFMPTTEINGKNIGFDPLQSTSEKIVTMKETLIKYVYNWIYDSKEDYDNRKVTTEALLKNFQNKDTIDDGEIGVGNHGSLIPPGDPSQTGF